MKVLCFGIYLILAGSFSLAAEPTLIELLDFELGAHLGRPVGWGGGPTESIHADDQVVHGGQWSCRLERDADSENSFTTVTRSIPVEKQGKFITLRGYLKTEDVEDFVGLWMRLDGAEGGVEFDNMQQRQLNGTNDWAEYTIALPFNPAARKIYFGALIAGPGKVWIDDLQLLVDGKPYDQAPEVVREITVLDTDQEFAAGSGITATALTGEQVENLALLGKVWGFLKYHHPAVTGGQRHWDFDLFRVLPQMLEAADRKEAVGELLTWIGALGEVPPCDPCAQLQDDLAGKPRLEWLQDEKLLGRALGRQLQEIYRNRPADSQQFYISLYPRVGNPVLQKEQTYADLGFPDAGFRLLALFRYWNIIEYWFPNRDLIDRDWDEVLTAYLPEVLASADEASYQLAFLRLIAEVDDGHANLYSAAEYQPPSGPCRLPVVIRFVENQAVVTAYADSLRGPATGLLVGDVIQEIDGRKVSELVAEWIPFYPASNQPHRLATMARNLTRGAWGPCRLKVARAGDELELKPSRVASQRSEMMAGRTHDLPGDTFQLLSPEVAYLKLSSVELPETAGYLEQAAGTRGLVIDIRNYPSAFMVFALGNRLVTESTPFVCFTRGDLDNPGAFVWRSTLSLSPLKPAYEGTVVVLVDEASMSQAEYTAMAFRASPKATVIGSTTAGADGNISRINLPGGLGTNISGIGVYYPDRAPTQRVGIVPDQEVLPTIEGIRQGRDEVLEAAIRKILGPEVADHDILEMYR